MHKMQIALYKYVLKPFTKNEVARKTDRVKQILIIKLNEVGDAIFIV